MAEREEAQLGAEEGYHFDGCQRDLFEMEQPDGLVVVGIDGSYVRDREGSWFEVIAGKGLASFERDAAVDEAGGTAHDVAPPGRCFAFVQAFDDRPRRRVFEMLRGLCYQPNQKLVMLSDSGESVRTLSRRIGLEAEHVRDWFHVAMRVTALGQMVKGAAAEDRWRDERLGDLERVKQLLWHGHAREAEDSVGWIEADVDGERRAKLKTLGAAVREFQVYIHRNAGSVIDYGERYRAGERRSSGFVESAINQVVAKRFSKRQSMRRTMVGTCRHSTWCS